MRRMVIITVILGMSVIALGQTRPATRSSLLGQARSILARDGVDALAKFLDAGDPLQAMDVYERLQQDLYTEAKDVSRMVAVSRAGIAHGLSRSENASDRNTATSLRKSAKAIAYNLASYTWPGWNEPGIVISAEDRAHGMEAARLNLRLAEELTDQPRPKAAAHWAVGAHELAAGQYTQAQASFDRAKHEAGMAHETAMELMLEGYELMAQVLAKPDDAGARRKFDDVVDELKDEGSEQARGYAQQLETAAKALALSSNKSSGN
jgi:hypothetical protein